MSAHPDPGLLDGALLSPAERASLLAHLRDCAECRAGLAGRDPSLLFALLPLEPVPHEVAERVSRAVAAALDAEGCPRPRAWSGQALLPLAAALLLSLLGFTLLQLEPERSGGTALLRVPVVPAVPVGMVQLLSPGTAEVLEISLADAEVLMIFDERLDL